MKKQCLLFALCAFFSAGAIAQTTSMTSKNGHEILPQEGDYSLSMNAVPLVDFALNAMNIMNNTGQTAATPDYATGFDQTIVGKQFTSATTADRVRVSIAHYSASTSTFADDGSGGEIEDVAKTRETDILLGYGKEMRRGHNRLQGFYGYEGMLQLGGGGTSNEYGSDLADGASRQLSTSDGLSFGLGARGFVGAEYFFAPKMSVGAEFGWGLGITRDGRGSTETETNDGGSISTTETDGSTSGGEWGFEVDNGPGSTLLGGGSAALTLNLHF